MANNVDVLMAKREAKKVSPRAELLDEAKQIITGDRNNSYGPPDQDFRRTAAIVTAMWEHKLAPGQKIESHEVAQFLIAVKLSRLQWSPEKRDNWLDGVGYFGCGYEAYLLGLEK